MPTSDYNLANQSGSSFRTDLNNCLSAIVSLNSSGSAPSSTFSYMLWADTSNNLLKMRNAANNGWIELRQLDGGMTMSEDATINSITVGKGANSVAGNTCVGEDALDAAVTGQNNTALGKEVLTANTSGTRNTAIGRQSMDANTLGDDNTACGVNALSQNLEADDNVAVGAWAMEANTEGEYNTACGYNALTSNIGADSNSAFGYKTLNANTSGHSNCAFGYKSSEANTTGDFNNSFGFDALSSNTVGSHNCAFGYNSLTAGNHANCLENTAYGHRTLVTTVDGYYNTAIGAYSMYNADTAIKNTCVGFNSGDTISSGQNNLLLGAYAGKSTSPSGAISSSSHNVCLGDNNITSLYCKVSTIQTSDIRDKTDVTDFKHGLSWVEKLRPITYRWDMRSNYEDGVPDGSKKEEKIHLGFIAQEELEIERKHGFANDKNDMLLVNENTDGNYGMYYDRLVPILVNAIKELSAKVTALEGG